MTSCVPTTAGLTAKGYGRAWFNGTRQYAHRVAYAEAHGLSILDLGDAVVRHTCDNPCCVNPAHLLLGTPRDNTDDMIERNRVKRGVELPQTKLTEPDKANIRARFTPWCKINGQKALAVEYGVTITTIQRINHGDYKHG